jgi:kinesin family protein 2/24
VSSENSKICVLVRKRPLSKKELGSGEIDCVSASNPKIYVHECKIKVDGITKYLEDHEFLFDNSFNDKETTEDVYRYSIYPMINLVLNRGIVTCFAYGQTGSGKTYTMVKNK